jgi:hypothetical protein
VPKELSNHSKTSSFALTLILLLLLAVPLVGMAIAMWPLPAKRVRHTRSLIIEDKLVVNEEDDTSDVRDGTEGGER